jgi:hypothetical protein
MVLISVGALALILGFVQVVLQPLRRGRLSGGQRRSTSSLEPRQPARGFGLRATWPGLVLIAVGGVLLVAAAL